MGYNSPNLRSLEMTRDGYRRVIANVPLIEESILSMEYASGGTDVE